MNVHKMDVEQDVLQFYAFSANKKLVMVKIINDLEKHYELLKTVYPSDVDLCNKLINLVHQVNHMTLRV